MPSRSCADPSGSPLTRRTTRRRGRGIVTPPAVGRASLELYAEGQPVDSERDSFSAWVHAFRETDPEPTD